MRIPRLQASGIAGKPPAGCPLGNGDRGRWRRLCLPHYFLKLPGYLELLITPDNCTTQGTTPCSNLLHWRGCCKAHNRTGKDRRDKPKTRVHKLEHRPSERRQHARHMSHSPHLPGAKPVPVVWVVRTGWRTATGAMQTADVPALLRRTSAPMAGTLGLRRAARGHAEELNRVYGVSVDFGHAPHLHLRHIAHDSSLRAHAY